MEKERIQLLEIIDSIIRDVLVKETIEYEKEALQMILSNSRQAATFVTIIEEEFNIEFDDDDINIDFFSSLDKITDLINLHSRK
jgi:acyl carrier protein